MQRVRLHQQALKLDAIQELAQGLDLAAVVGGVGALGDRYAQAVGVQAHLGDKTSCAGGRRFQRSNPAASCHRTPECQPLQAHQAAL